MSRIGPNGTPIDLILVNSVVATIQEYFPSLMNWYIEYTLNSKFNHETYCLKPNHRPLRMYIVSFFIS